MDCADAYTGKDCPGTPTTAPPRELPQTGQNVGWVLTWGHVMILAGVLFLVLAALIARHRR